MKNGIQASRRENGGREIVKYLIRWIIYASFAIELEEFFVRSGKAIFMEFSLIQRGNLLLVENGNLFSVRFGLSGKAMQSSMRSSGIQITRESSDATRNRVSWNWPKYEGLANDYLSYKSLGNDCLTYKDLTNDCLTYRWFLSAAVILQTPFYCVDLHTSVVSWHTAHCASEKNKFWKNFEEIRSILKSWSLEMKTINNQWAELFQFKLDY
jgi:hypothetical protein